MIYTQIFNSDYMASELGLGFEGNWKGISQRRKRVVVVFFFKHPSRGRVGRNRPHRSDRQPSTSRAIKSGGRKSACVSYTRRSTHLACFPHAGAWERVGPPSSTSFSLRRRQPSTSIPCHSTCLSDHRNSVLQRFLGPTVILPRVFASVSCFLRPSVISKGVLWIVGPSSIPVQCFSWEGGPFPYKIQFFLYFSDFL